MKNLPRRQRGAVAMTVVMLLLCLLGFMGSALDLGKAFTVHSELQTAMDSCALAAAQELDAASDALTRARSAGISAGNANRVALQSVNWDGKGQIVSGDITFLAADYSATSDATAAKYARCEHTQGSLKPWLLGAMAMFTGDTKFANALSVRTHAVAKRGSTQSTCPIPLALLPPTSPQTCKVAGVTPDAYGFCAGNWLTLLYKPGGGAQPLGPGMIGWANLDGSTNASETEAEMNGHCGTKVGDTLGTPGVQQSIADAWNFRFGLYKQAPDYTDQKQRPDYTGYPYTATNWSKQSDAYGDFKAKRLAFTSYCTSSTNPKNCDSTYTLKPNAKNESTSSEHQNNGKDRRIVLVPMVDASMKVKDYGCLLMLQPLSTPAQDIQLEYLGLANTPSTPCTTSGIPGGTTGPLVPVLVE